MRLFVAADLPDDARAACAAWRDAAAAEGLRPVADASLHVTLAFLGEREDPAPVAAALEACPGPARDLAFAAGRLLPARRPQVVALELSDPRGELGALQARVAEAVGVREARRFLPHVTVARVRRAGRAAGALPPAPDAGPFAMAALTLYRSRLGGGPARYEPLARWPLA